MKPLLTFLLLVGTTLMANDSLFVAVEKVSLRSRPDALSPLVRELAFKTEVVPEGEFDVVPPALDGTGGIEGVLGWVKVAAGFDSGYLPVSVLANQSTMAGVESDADFFEREALSVKRGFSEAEDDVALATMRGFSEKEDDVVLSTMKGAAGSGRVAEKQANGMLAAVLSTTVVLDDMAVSSFRFDGELFGDSYRPSAVRSSKSYLARVKASQRVSAQQMALLKKATEMSKNSKDEELRMMLKAAETMAEQSGGVIDPIREFRLGRFVASRVLPLYKVVQADDPRSSYLNQVGRFVAMASNNPESYSGYRFMLVESKEVNAFAIPGGFVFVTTGMMDFLRDEDELAAILGHEISHIELRHGLSSVGTEKILQMFSVAKDFALKKSAAPGEKEMMDKLFDEVFREMFKCIRNGYGMEIEGQADSRGIQLCARLGYDILALKDVLVRFKAMKGTYGGAGYPVERAADIDKYRRRFGFDHLRPRGREGRKARYDQAMGR